MALSPFNAPLMFTNAPLIFTNASIFVEFARGDKFNSSTTPGYPSVMETLNHSHLSLRLGFHSWYLSERISMRGFQTELIFFNFFQKSLEGKSVVSQVKSRVIQPGSTNTSNANRSFFPRPLPWASLFSLIRLLIISYHQLLILLFYYTRIQHCNYIHYPCVIQY
jgi:hypothetical protein